MSGEGVEFGAENHIGAQRIGCKLVNFYRKQIGAENKARGGIAKGPE